MLTEEQVKDIKRQIIAQIEAGFPEERKGLAKKRIESMNSEELESFLAKNNLPISSSAHQETAQQCVFCSIVSGKIESQKIDENESAIAVLEINPISRGHALIIPKEHDSSQEKGSEKNIKKLIKSISSTIKKKLKPKKVIVSEGVLFGHEIINIIPKFQEEDINSKRNHSTPEELFELKVLLTERKKKIRVEKMPKKTIIKAEEKIWLPRRIP